MEDKPQRASGSTVIPVSMPKSLVRDIDARAEAFNLSRSKFITIVTESAVRHPGPLLVYAEQDAETEPVELTEAAHNFLLAALPEMIEFERRLKGNPAASPPKPSREVTRSKLWTLFLKQRDEILKHKWLESQKAGRDIGTEAALRDWLQKHNDKWVETLKED